MSAESKALIARILHLNPSFRPSLDEILEHEFFHTNSFIPKLLPSSTLAVAPSLKQLQSSSTNNESEKPLTTRSEFSNNDLNNANIDINNKITPQTERIVRKDINLEDDEKLVFDNKPNTVRDIEDKNKDKDKDRGMRTLAISV